MATSDHPRSAVDLHDDCDVFVCAFIIMKASHCDGSDFASSQFCTSLHFQPTARFPNFIGRGKSPSFIFAYSVDLGSPVFLRTLFTRYIFSSLSMFRPQKLQSVLKTSHIFHVLIREWSWLTRCLDWSKSLTQGVQNPPLMSFPCSLNCFRGHPFLFRDTIINVVV